MDYQKIVQRILDIGEEMLICGAENFRLEDSMYRMCEAYGFLRSDVFVIPSNIQITVETPQGELITQIRQIENRSIDFTHLDQLNSLCRYVCQYSPDEIQLAKEYHKAQERAESPWFIRYIAGAMGVTGFGIFFGCNDKDAILCVLAALCLTAAGHWIGKHENNQFLYNLYLAFIAEIIIILCVSIGIGQHPERVMIACVMLLISALGLTNGIRDLLQSDFFSGLLNILNAMLGGLGIATGIALAMLIMHKNYASILVVNESILIQVICCGIACSGFALVFHVRKSQIMSCALGAAASWTIYSMAYSITENNLLATVVGSFFVGVYAFFMARIHKTPSTIFLTVSMLPLLPGPRLYYVLFCYLKREMSMFSYNGWKLLESSVGIALGFIVADILIKMIQSIIFFLQKTKESF